MKLHQDLDAFIMLLEDVHQKTGYRLDVLEKDYYVVLMLYELAAKQKEGLKAYFKGGTALYKALKMLCFLFLLYQSLYFQGLKDSMM